MPFTVRNPRLDRLLDEQVREDFKGTPRKGSRADVVERILHEYFAAKKAEQKSKDASK